jgi:hypothetical protein
MKKVTFIPDFTATIRDDCTYLEINAQTYLLAYKSTLINKNRTDKDAINGFDDTRSASSTNEIPMNKSKYHKSGWQFKSYVLVTSEGNVERDSVVLRPNGSLKRKNVSLY